MKIRATGIEPVSHAWEARVLPLNDARVPCAAHSTLPHLTCQERKAERRQKNAPALAATLRTPCHPPPLAYSGAFPCGLRFLVRRWREPPSAVALLPPCSCAACCPLPCLLPSFESAAAVSWLSQPSPRLHLPPSGPLPRGTGSSTADSQSFRGALLCFLLYCPLRVNARRCSSQAITSARTSQGKMLEKRRFEGWRAILQRQENTWKTSRHPAAGHGSRGAYKGEQACTRKVERQCTAGRFSSLAKGAGSICDGGAR